METDMDRRRLMEVNYYAASQAFASRSRSCGMETPGQATQRSITLASLALVQTQRNDVHVFNDVLIQYPRGRRRTPAQAVPDNMVVLRPGPIEAEVSFDLPFQPSGPFWVLDYISKHGRRKHYDRHYRRYEKWLKVPYYLLYSLDTRELSLFRHSGEQYASVAPNERGRLPIPELELEAALLDGWARFWFRGELLPLPADLQRERDAARRLAEEEARARRAAEEEVNRLRAELEQLRQQAGER